MLKRVFEIFVVLGLPLYNEKTFMMEFGAAAMDNHYTMEFGIRYLPRALCDASFRTCNISHRAGRLFEILGGCTGLGDFGGLYCVARHMGQAGRFSRTWPLLYIFTRREDI